MKVDFCQHHRCDADTSRASTVPIHFGYDDVGSNDASLSTCSSAFCAVWQQQGLEASASSVRDSSSASNPHYYLGLSAFALP